MFSIFEKKKNFKYEILAASILVITVWIYFFHGGSTSLFLFMAAIIGLYMAINIGANDIANNMGPAVGSGAINIKGALIIAAIFEAAGAILAGGDVVNTISKGIIDPTLIPDVSQFLAIMMATLAGAALWVNIATYFKAPVSTTHSIVGGLVGAGITAVGTSIVNWNQIWQIVASWVISPIMGGIISVILLLSIRKNILKKDDRGEAAKVWVPIYIGAMVWAFATYMLEKGLHQVLNGTDFELLIKPEISLFVGYVIGVLTFIILRIYYKKRSAFFKNSKDFINELFNIPLIFAVALLSFAHGANDVANAIGPLSAINDTIKNHISAGGVVKIETWVILIGSMGLVLGLAVFGARLIKTVGNEITKLNQIRAYCVALSAAITVIVASALGLPVSSTHIALGGVFGIGLIRQHIKRKKGNNKEYIDLGMIKNIALAWIITLPVSAFIAGISYLVIIQF
ncbi:MAG: inorganic phosphate transporter [Candidatus Gracilibacteria bacterium]|nr:inorganic phosphate transporter [Candidatus Gracilibacteria bacterium]